MVVSLIATACLLASRALSLTEIEGSFAEKTAQVAMAALGSLCESSEWQSFEQQHSEQVKALEVACKGYLPCASRNDQRLRDRLHRAGLGDDVIDEICSREDDFNDMLPSMG